MLQGIDLPPYSSGFQPEGSLYSLHRNVIFVAETRPDGKWVARLYTVEGKNHREEALKANVHRRGSPIAERIARAAFQRPPFSDMEYAT